jgi:hypothetical protein
VHLPPNPRLGPKDDLCASTNEKPMGLGGICADCVMILLMARGGATSTGTVGETPASRLAPTQYR